MGNETKTVSVNFGGSFMMLAAIALSVLKVTGVIDIGWGWALSPLWLPFAFVMALVGVALVLFGLVTGAAWLFLVVSKALGR